MKTKNTTFYCFSPPVMLATFSIEILLMIYTLIRYRMNITTRLVAASLILLGIFQFAEYHVCQGSGGTTGLYSHLGYVAIALLPPVGLHLVRAISGKGSNKLIALAYASATGFIVTFGLSATAFRGYECAGNYAVFQLADNLGGTFFAYYYFWLIVGIMQCMQFSIDASRRIRQALIYQAFGYLSFILPTGIVNALNPATISGIPSIMCGFAVIYALILTFGIAPLILKQKLSAAPKART